MIVDAHAHIFRQIAGQVGAGHVSDLGQGAVLVGGRERVQVLPPGDGPTAFTPETLLAQMEWAGVAKAVLLQGPFYGERNHEVAETVRRWPGRFVGAAYIDPWGPQARAHFQEAVELHGLRIVKLELSYEFGLAGLHPGLRLDDPAAAWLWREMERRGLVLTLDLGAVGGCAYQIQAAEAIIRQHPDLRVVLPHLGGPTLHVETDELRRQQWEACLQLGRYPNVWFDLAALPDRTGEPYPYPTMGRWLRRAAELAGPNKLMWGSDVPGLLALATYPQLLRAVRDQLDFLPADSRQAILGGTALKVYAFD